MILSSRYDKLSACVSVLRIKTDAGIIPDICFFYACIEQMHKASKLSPLRVALILRGTEQLPAMYAVVMLACVVSFILCMLYALL